ncbi:MAG: MFS transporter [Gemmatimonadota bacterium]
MRQPAADLGVPRATVVLGLRENWRQFALLVLVNAFVGAMVGLERTVVPLIAEREFGLASRSAVLVFIASFGAVKAVTNLFAGRLGDRFGRKPVLIAGWLLGLSVPFLVIWAPSWSWIVVANIILGANQGLAWSTTVIMKIDLVGPSRRGLAMGLNEFAGYVAVALAAYASGVIAERFGLRPEPFYLGIAFAAAGLALSLLFVRETAGHARHEGKVGDGRTGVSEPMPPGRVFALVSWRDPALSSVSQAGLVNNLNDGVAWGLFPLYFAAAGLSLREIGALVAAYPMAWGITQLVTGALSDRIGRKWLIVSGMFVQGVALVGMAADPGPKPWLAWAVLLGLGTGMVYPTLLAVVGDVAHPLWRGSAVGVYRWWRDLGYVAGAIIGGLLADRFGIQTALVAVGVLTAGSGALVAARMPETRWRPAPVQGTW